MTAYQMSVNMVADAMVTCPKTQGPECRLEDIRRLFEDDHVHMALIVTAERQLLTTIERPDLPPCTGPSTLVTELGTLAGRTVAPSDSLDVVTAKLIRQGRRRLAVVDASGRLLGLLCLKRDLTGYCSDEGVHQRARAAAMASS
jgi:CBS-domain-containing membrane protein